MHVDFSEVEAEIVCKKLAHNFAVASYKIPVARRIAMYALSSDCPDTWRDEVENCLHTRALPGREKGDVVKFVEDCLEGYRLDPEGFKGPVGSSFIQIVPIKRTSPRSLIVPSSGLRFKREMGRGIGNEPYRNFQTRVRDTMAAWMSVNRGSSDVVAVGWSPDGQRFGLGCEYSNIPRLFYRGLWLTRIKAWRTMMSTTSSETSSMAR